MVIQWHYGDTLMILCITTVEEVALAVLLWCHCGGRTVVTTLSSEVTVVRPGRHCGESTVMALCCDETRSGTVVALW